MWDELWIIIREATNLNIVAGKVNFGVVTHNEGLSILELVQFQEITVVVRLRWDIACFRAKKCLVRQIAKVVLG